MNYGVKEMFKTSRNRIVTAIMGILTLLWIATMCAIYFFSYLEISSTNKTMLEEYADRYVLNKPIEWNTMRKPVPNQNHMWNEKQLKLATFYSVLFSKEGKLIEIRNDPTAVYSEEELENFAEDVLSQRKNYGRYKELTFYKAVKNETILVIFMDNTILSESMNTLFRYTMVFGCGVILILYFAAVYLARKIVAPLEEGYKKQRQFISDAGHELKTPISIINTNAELLSMELENNPWLEHIKYENERMGKLVIQLLDLARTESVKLQTERINFSHLTNGEILVFDSVAYEQGIYLKVNILPDLYINANASQIKQLISILLDNAMEHGRDKDEITVALSKEHKWAKLSVINKGEEIPFEQRKNLFDRFYRVNEARTGDSRHYGLGLAIAKSIVDAHGGKINVTCYSGLVEFTVLFPISG